MFSIPQSSKKMGLKEIPTESIAQPLGRNEVLGLLFRLTIFGAVTYFTIKWMVDAIDPTRKQKMEAQKQVKFSNIDKFDLFDSEHLLWIMYHVCWDCMVMCKGRWLFTVGVFRQRNS